MTTDDTTDPTAVTREALAEHEFVSGMDARLLDELASMATWRGYPADTWITHAGDPSDAFHLVMAGRAGIEVGAPGHEPLIVSTVHAGDVIGWSWIIDRQPWQFDVIALDDVRTLAIDTDRLLGACAADPDLRHEITARLLRVVASRLAGTRLQLVDVYGRVR